MKDVIVEMVLIVVLFGSIVAISDFLVFHI